MASGKKHSAITGCDDQSFLWPNDLVYGSNGAIYLTDLGVKVDGLFTGSGVDASVWQGEMKGCLYRIDLVSCLDKGFLFTNGIAFDPDGKLHINEMVTGYIYRYDFEGEVIVESREVFASVTMPYDGFGGYSFR